MSSSGGTNQQQVIDTRQLQAAPYAWARVAQLGLAAGRSNPAYDASYCGNTYCVDAAHPSQVDNDVDPGVESVVD
jgi:hypothetical protein